MPSARIFTPGAVQGATNLQWRALPSDDGRWIIQARLVPDGSWFEQSDKVVQTEIRHGTEAGTWLARFRRAAIPQ